MIYHVIVNPAGASGKTGRVWKRVEPLFRESGQEYEVHYSSPGHGIADICRELEETCLSGPCGEAPSDIADAASAASGSRPADRSCRAPEEQDPSETNVSAAESDAQGAGTPREKLVIITVGGDGSVNEAMNGITDPSRIFYGHIPAGSGNDLIRDMHLPKKAEDVARSILEGQVKRYFDVGELTYLDKEDRASGSVNVDGAPSDTPEDSAGDTGAGSSKGMDSTQEDQTGNFDADISGKVDGAPEIERAWAAHIGSGASRRFAISCGIGFDAGICEMAGRSRFKDVLNKVGLGKLIYIVSAFRIVSGQESRAVELILDGVEDDPSGAGPGAKSSVRKMVHYDHLLLLACMNHQYEGGGFRFAPDAAYDDGILNLCIADPPKNSAFYKIFPFALFGEHYRFRCIHAHAAREIEVRTQIPMWVHTDGEVERKARRIRIRVLKEKLAVLE